MGANDFTGVYGRYKTQLDKEDELINNRVKWLLGTQTILFAAIKVTSGKSVPEILGAVSIVGLASSIAIGVSILAAILSFLKYRRNLHRKYDSVKSRIGQTYYPQKIDYPQLNRSERVLLAGHIAAIALPAIFVLGWCLMIGGSPLIGKLQLMTVSLIIGQPLLMKVSLIIGYIAAIALPVIFVLGWSLIGKLPNSCQQEQPDPKVEQK